MNNIMWIKNNIPNNENVLEKYTLYHNHSYQGVLCLWQYTAQQLSKAKQLPTKPFYIFNSKKDEYIIDAKSSKEAKEKALECLEKEKVEQVFITLTEDLTVDKLLELCKEYGIPTNTKVSAMGADVSHIAYTNNMIVLDEVDLENY